MAPEPQAQAPKVFVLADYRPMPYNISETHLAFQLNANETTVTNKMTFARAQESKPGEPLVLNGKDLVLEDIRVNDIPLTIERDYHFEGDDIVLTNLPEFGTITVKNKINPADNKSCMGLYMSKGILSTQCEPQGFRQITYYPDRPDNRSKFTVEMTADQETYPVLLSNGERVAYETQPNGRHYAKWVDPFPKPSYLFALVAGKLAMKEAVYERQEPYVDPWGKQQTKVKVRIMVEEKYLDQVDHAMDVAIKSLAWDERRYLPYDLNELYLVGIEDFNAGAMENKGLTIFNISCLVGNNQTATDSALEFIVDVVSHELAHNYAGNRVGVKTPHYLSLKEGLATAKEQEFVQQYIQSDTYRIGNIDVLKRAQFPEDASATAHPVLPSSYSSPQNLYTTTIYQKGAELLAMIRMYLGDAGWVNGLKHYFQKHDNQAVDLDDFLTALSEANEGINMARFKGWYTQSGTPHLRFEEHYDAATQRYTLTVHQHTPPTADQAQKEPLPIPVAVGLLNGQGQDMFLQLEGEAAPQGQTRMLLATEASQSFTFVNVSEKPVASLMRNFSAPVKVDTMPHSKAEQLFLLAHDSDAVNQWEIGARMIKSDLMAYIQAMHNKTAEHYAFDEALMQALKSIYLDKEKDYGIRALLLTLPDAAELMAEDWPMPINPELVYAGIKQYNAQIAAVIGQDALEATLGNIWDNMPERDDNAFYPEDAQRRALTLWSMQRLLEHQAASEATTAAEAMIAYGKTMTERAGGIAALIRSHDPKRRALANETLDLAFDEWQNNAVTHQQWLRLKAMDASPDVVSKLRQLMDNPKHYDRFNPDHARMLRTFAALNPHFHHPSGAGYDLLADVILFFDEHNPDVTTYFTKSLTRWQNLDNVHQHAMLKALRRVATQAKSPEVLEIVDKALKNAPPVPGPAAVTPAATQASAMQQQTEHAQQQLERDITSTPVLH